MLPGPQNYILLSSLLVWSYLIQPQALSSAHHGECIGCTILLFMFFCFSHLFLVFERSEKFHWASQGKLISLLASPLRTINYWLDFIDCQRNLDLVSVKVRAGTITVSLFSAVQIMCLFCLKTDPFVSLPLKTFSAFQFVTLLIKIVGHL